MEEIRIKEVNDTSVVYNQHKATIDTNIAIAKVYPLNTKSSLNNARVIVTLDSESILGELNFDEQ